MSDTDRVPDYCTCGAELPPDAIFCHKCGKPQIELPVVESEPQEVRPVEPAAAEPTAEAGISFRNRLAVRIGLMAAIVSSLLTSLPMPMVLNVLFMIVGPVGAGFLAVYLYRRRTGEELTARMGAHMGWITGVFCFAITTIMFTITMIMITMQGGLSAFYREQVAGQAGAGVNMEEFYSLLESPAGLASILFFSLLLMFLFFTLLPTLGGAMGAKVLEKE